MFLVCAVPLCVHMFCFGKATFPVPWHSPSGLYVFTRWGAPPPPRPSWGVSSYTYVTCFKIQWQRSSGILAIVSLSMWQRRGIGNIPLVCLYSSLHAAREWKTQTLCFSLTNIIRMPTSDLVADWVIVHYVTYLLCGKCWNHRVTFTLFPCTVKVDLILF